MRLPAELDVAVIGGGQAALAVGYYLRRTGLDFSLIDDQASAGGAWQRTWPSLRLFSPAQWSSLPGFLMPRDQSSSDEYPSRDRTIAYLREYETRYTLPVARPVHVTAVRRADGRFVGELSQVADVTWATLTPPTFLPDEIDGRYLFEQATARYRALQEGRTPDPPRSLGDIVAVAPVRDARARGALNAVQMFERFTSDGVMWPDRREQHVDAVIFATGFRPALKHLAPLGVTADDGRVDIQRSRSRARSVGEPMLWLVGYGEWTGFASATLIGVGRSARAVVEEIAAALA